MKGIKIISTIKTDTHNVPRGTSIQNFTTMKESKHSQEDG